MPKKYKKPVISHHDIAISKTACHEKPICIMVTTRYGLQTGTCSLKQAAIWCDREERIIKQWLDNKTITDKAAAQLLAIYVAGVLPWEAFEGFRIMDDGKMIDTVGHSHSFAEIQERGHYWAENQRLRRMLDIYRTTIEKHQQESKDRPVRAKPTLRLVK